MDDETYGSGARTPSSTPTSIRDARARQAMDDETYGTGRWAPGSTPTSIRDARARQAMDDETYGTGTPPRSSAPAYRRAVPRNAILAAARRIEHGRGPGWRHGHHVPYSWAAGHGRRPGPTKGVDDGVNGNGYDARTVGVDCSGFTRWVYSIAYHHDILGRSKYSDTNAQIHTLHRDAHRHPGDLVFFGSGRNSTEHVGVYLGHGMMIDAPESHPVHMNVTTQPVGDGGHVVGYYRGPTVRVRRRG